MSCWCGHGPWHHHMYSWPPPYQTGYPSPEYYGPPPAGRRPRRRAAEVGEPADDLREPEQGIARARRGLENLCDSRSQEQ